MKLQGDDRLALPSWARLKFCAVRGRWILLVPERVLYPCPQTVEVLQRLDTPTRFADIVGAMADEYDAAPDVIEDDLAPILGNLVEDGYVRRLDA